MFRLSARSSLFRAASGPSSIIRGPSAAATAGRFGVQQAAYRRNISSSTALYKDNEKVPAAAIDAEGGLARTDDSVRVEYHPDDEMPQTPIVQGRGGRHFKRTLASFSLEGRVSVITGGARGLGLVMGQALVASGSDLAIVDLNSTLSQQTTKNN